MRCAACGRENPAAARFCNECGQPLALRCDACGAEQPGDAKFCNACGSALVERQQLIASTLTTNNLPSGDTERRQLTVLFCDLVGSTELSTRLDSEDFSEAIRAYHDAATQVVTRFGGHVAQLLGDGLLVLFGYPQSHEDSAEQAVRAALDIVSAVDGLGRGLAIRVGLHSGLCVVSDVGAGGRQETLAFGEALNVAARVQAAAPPGGVLMSAATHRLVAGWFVVEEAVTHTLKGLPEPLTLYRVLRASAARSRLEAHSLRGFTPLVGREAERRLLLERWAQARGGEGQVVLITGEPGIGKSRLVRVLREHIADQPHRWLEGSCSLFMRNTAFHPIVELVERGLGFIDGDQPAERMRRLEDGLRLVGRTAAEPLALLASFLSLPQESAAALAGLSPEARRRRTLDGLVEWVVALSEREPLVILVEDLHWCDPSSLELLNRIVERTAAARILTLVTYRPELSPSWPALPHVSALSLQRMSGPQASEIVRELIARAVLPDLVQKHIVERADGIPLFIEELTQMVLESESLRTSADVSKKMREPATLEIPATLQSSLMARLDRLGQAKEIAQVAAVVGREFSYELLSLVVGGGHLARIREEDLHSALIQLMDAGLVYQAAAPATYVFKHALLQEAAYQSVLKKTRRQLHARIVQVLREHFPERVEAQAEMAARHAEAAGLLDDAIVLYERAAEQAAGRSAREEALLHLRSALAVLATEPASVERDRREAGLQRALAAELIAARGYGHPETAAAWERMRALSQAAGDRQSYGAALLGLALVHYASAQFERASELIDEGLVVAESAGDAVHMVAAYTEKTSVAYFQGRFRSSLQYAERAMALYDPERHHHALVSLVGDDSGVSAQSISGWALWQLGYPDRALARGEEAVRLALSLDHPFSIAQTYVWRLGIHMERGDDVLRERASEALRFSETQGFPLWSGVAKMWLGYAISDPAMLLDGLAMAAGTGNQGGAPAMFFMLADAYRSRGLHADALATVDAGLATAAATSVPFYDANLYRLRGEIVLVDGGQAMSESRRIAEECFRRALEIARGQEAKSIELRAATSLARLLCAQGRHEEGRALLAPIYTWFREGLDTHDLLEAKALLAELGT